jgi:4-amino-4-deoxy-L-arabinose transferase-like glycosyltransferase
MTRTERRLVASAATLATAALALGIGSTELWPPDEPRVAEIAREMLVDRTWLLPRLDGVPFLEEPPLFYWFQAAAFAAAGEPSAAAARWPAALSAVLGVFLTISLARAVGASAGIAALVLATAPEYWWMARSGTPDTAAAVATALSLTFFFSAWQSGRVGLLAAAAAAAGVAFWLKSFLGVGLATLTVVTFLALAGLGRLRPYWVVLAGLGVGAITGCWLFILWWIQGGEGVGFFVLANHLGRLVGSPEHGHGRSVFYYLANLALDLLPWSLALPAAVAVRRGTAVDPGRLFLLTWAGAMMLALTVAATKRAHYLLPAYPAFAVLIAQWWLRPGDRGLDRLTRHLVALLLLVVCPLATLALLSFEPQTALASPPTGKHGAASLALALLRTPIRPSTWVAASAVLVLSLAFCREQARNPARAAVLAAACATALHLLIVLVVLPRFNAFASTRPWGESLGRAGGCTRVVSFGFPNREALSPFMFYARRRIPQARSVRRLDGVLRGGRRGCACALIRASAYPTLASTIGDLPRTFGSVGRLPFVLVSARCSQRVARDHAGPGPCAGSTCPSP